MQPKTYSHARKQNGVLQKTFGRGYKNGVPFKLLEDIYMLVLQLRKRANTTGDL